MTHHSGKHTIRWTPTLGKIYSSVTYTNRDKKVVVSVKSAIFWPYSGHILATSTQFAKTDNGKIFI